MVTIMHLFISFLVWGAWPVVVFNLPDYGYNLTFISKLILILFCFLGSSLSRILWDFLATIFGVINWLLISTLLLILPCLWMAAIILFPSENYIMLLAVSSLTGLASGSSVTVMRFMVLRFSQRDAVSRITYADSIGGIGFSFSFFIGLLFSQSGISQGCFYLYPLLYIPLVFVLFFVLWFSVKRDRDFLKIDKVFTCDLNNKEFFSAMIYGSSLAFLLGATFVFPFITRLYFKSVNPLDYAFFVPIMGVVGKAFGNFITERGSDIKRLFIINAVVVVVCLLIFMTGFSVEGSFVLYISFYLLFMFVLGVESGIAMSFSSSLYEEEVSRMHKNVFSFFGVSGALSALFSMFIPTSIIMFYPDMSLFISFLLILKLTLVLLLAKKQTNQ